MRREGKKGRRTLLRFLCPVLIAGALAALLYFYKFTEFYSQGTEYTEGKIVLEKHFGSVNDRRLGSVLWKAFVKAPATGAYRTCLKFETARAVRVIVTEEEPVFSLPTDTGQYYLLTAGGALLCETSDPEDTFRLLGIRVTTAEDFAVPVTEPEQALEDGIRVYRGMIETKLPGKTIEYRDGGFLIHLENVTVSLGTTEDLQEKLNIAWNQLPSYEGLRGTIHLEKVSGGQTGGFTFTVE